MRLCAARLLDYEILDWAMKITFDPEMDVLRIILRDAPIEESDEEIPGFILDYDSAGMIVGLEILDASKQGIDPRLD